MATVEEVFQMMKTLQEQQHALKQEISRLTAENLQFRQAGSPWPVEIATTGGQAVQIAISNANPLSNERQSLVDIKRPWDTSNVFKEESEKCRKTTGVLIAACGSAFPPVTEMMEDRDNVITNEALDRQFVPAGAEPVEDVQEKNEQVHVALLALTESENFVVVLERHSQVRKQCDGWSVVGGGEKRRALLRQICVPDRCKLQDLPAGFEKWEKLVRRYERSKSSGTTTIALGDDIKTAALEAPVPGELEQHLAMIRARLITYEKVRSEIQAYIEARRSQAPQIRWKWTALVQEARKSRKARKGKVMAKSAKNEGQHQNQNPNLSKDTVCWHCGKKSHLSTECWSNPLNPFGSGGTQNKGGEGKSKNVTGKGAGSLEQGEQAALVEPQPQPALASSPSRLGVETLVRSAHLQGVPSK